MTHRHPNGWQVGMEVIIVLTENRREADVRNGTITKIGRRWITFGHSAGWGENRFDADTMWIDGAQPNLKRLADTFDPARMDILLLMAPTANSIGYSGRGDFAMTPDGTLRKRKELEVVPFVYAGVAILSPQLFNDAPAGEFSLTDIFDRVGEQGRLFGLRMEGVWMHVGTPEAIAAAERAYSASVA